MGRRSPMQTPSCVLSVRNASEQVVNIAQQRAVTIGLGAIRMTIPIVLPIRPGTPKGVPWGAYDAAPLDILRQTTMRRLDITHDDLRVTPFGFELSRSKSENFPRRGARPVALLPIVRVTSMSHTKHFHFAAQFAFWGALLFSFYEAVIPPNRTVPLFPWDKAQHFAAFYVLTWLATAAFPRRSLITIALALFGFGALIEIVQAIPALGRDSDIKDWVADILGVLATLTPMLLVWWRKQFRTAA
jgi:VanZ family protein